MSGGTRASLAGVVVGPVVRVPRRPHAERARARAACARSAWARRSCSGVSVGTSEHFALPRVAPRLREVNAYLGWFGPASRAMQVFSAGTAAGHEGARGRPALGRGDRALREGLHRRAGRGGASQARLARRRRSPTTRRDGELVRGARDRRGRVHVHRQDPGLGRRAGGRRRAPGSRGARARPTASGSTRSWRAAARPASPSRAQDRRAGRRGARRRRLTGRVRLSRDPAARRRLVALAGAAALALVVGIARGLRPGRPAAGRAAQRAPGREAGGRRPHPAPAGRPAARVELRRHDGAAPT